MIYLFLDIDGVLNHRSSTAWATASNLTALDPHCLERYLTIVERYKDHLQVILSSTWRLYADAKLALVNAGVYFEDVTGIKMSSTRCEEIHWYITDHKVEDYIILDDDGSVLRASYINKDNVIATDFGEGGLNKAKAEEFEELIRRKLNL